MANRETFRNQSQKCTSEKIQKSFIIATIFLHLRSGTKLKGYRGEQPPTLKKLCRVAGQKQMFARQTIFALQFWILHRPNQNVNTYFFVLRFLSRNVDADKVDIEAE